MKQPLAMIPLCLCLTAAAALAQSPEPVDTGDAHSGQSLVGAESPEQVEKRLEWWSHARFGMFIHWGLYSHDGCFWNGKDGKTEHMMRHLQIPVSEYEKIAAAFNPVKFNADEWARIARDAGMQYMIITSKHHDGFAMFNSPSNDYNIVSRSPFARDPTKELADSCRAKGLRFGVYYSLGRDWHDPDVPTDPKSDGSSRSNFWDYPDETKKDFSKYFERKVKPQVRELLTQYGPIAALWFDTPEKISAAQSKELLDLVHSLQPDCIVNSRVGNRLGDYKVEEQRIPESGDPEPWETCMTLNRHWGFHKMDENWKPAETLVRNLIDIASKGGNFLLNVGPTGEGLIPTPSIERLIEIGAWLKINGEAIYGTTASPFRVPLAWGRCTKKVGAEETTLYLHVFDWPKDGKLVVPGLQNRVTGASLLSGGVELPTAPTADGVTINLPPTAPDQYSSTIALKIDGAPKMASE
jgi:alpha-L-fucosidase